MRFEFMFICIFGYNGLVIANVAPLSHSKTSISASEDTKIGSVIGKLTFVDPDGPEKLVIKPGDAATNALVRLGPVTVRGHQTSVDIILNSELDSDFHSPSRRLQFTAFDGKATKTISMQLQIQDINDNAPAFTQNEYTAKVSATAPLGSVVVIVTAIDPDITYGGVVHYSITTSDLFAYQALKVNSFAGMITVASPLVIKRGSDMHLKVVATDGGGLSSSANVTVSVI